MKKIILPLMAICSACTSINSSSKGEKQQVEISLHKVRADLEESKHDINTQQMQLSILEGKLARVDDLIHSIKIESSEKQKSTLEELAYHLTQIEKRLEKFEEKQKEVLGDLTQLASHANHTSKVLGQYKDKIKELEHNLTVHSEILTQVNQLKKHFKEEKDVSHNTETIIVKSGDSLQRIARQHSSSVEELRRLNNLKDDLIMVGQELIVPAKP
jgi:LysM repeat protein